MESGGGQSLAPLLKMTEEQRKRDYTVIVVAAGVVMTAVMEFSLPWILGVPAAGLVGLLMAVMVAAVRGGA